MEAMRSLLLGNKRQLGTGPCSFQCENVFTRGISHVMRVAARQIFSGQLPNRQRVD